MADHGGGSFRGDDAPRAAAPTGDGGAGADAAGAGRTFEVASLQHYSAKAVVTYLDLYSSLAGLPFDLADSIAAVLRAEVEGHRSSLCDDGLVAYVEVLRETVERSAELPWGVSPELTHLSLRFGARLTGDGLRQLASGGPAEALLSLDLAYCGRVDDAGLEAVAKRARHLQSVDLTACRSITDAGVERLVFWCRASLHTLCLALCRVTDVAVQTVVRQLKGLRDLSIGGCDHVTNVGVQLVAGHCAALTRLDLSGLKLTDFDLEDLGGTCFALRHLALRACRLLGDKGARHIAKLSNLKAKRGAAPLDTLDLGGCRGLTDKGLAMVVRQSKQLRLLDLRGTRCTDALVKLIAVALPELQRLVLLRCDAVTDDAVAALRAAAPRLAVER